jgi:hypothetical protein
MSESPITQPREINRMTIVSMIHHERTGDQPTSTQLYFADLLDTDNETYARRVTVTPEWSLLDFGWLDDSDVGVVCVENLVGKQYLVNPTDEESRADAAKVLELFIMGETPMLIRPRRHLYLESKTPWLLGLRCQQGEAKARITIFPK